MGTVIWAISPQISLNIYAHVFTHSLSDKWLGFCLSRLTFRGWRTILRQEYVWACVWKSQISSPLPVKLPAALLIQRLKFTAIHGDPSWKREPSGGVRRSQTQQNKWSWSTAKKTTKTLGNSLRVSTAEKKKKHLIRLHCYSRPYYAQTASRLILNWCCFSISATMGTLNI